MLLARVGGQLLSDPLWDLEHSCPGHGHLLSHWREMHLRVYFIRHLNLQSLSFCSHSATRMAMPQQRRMQSTFVKNWLSDPSTYPIMMIVGAALAGCSSFMLNKFLTDKNVRVSSATKGKVLRTW